MNQERLAQLHSIDGASEKLIALLDNSGALESESIQRAAYQLRLAVAQALGDVGRVAAAQLSVCELNDDEYLVASLEETRQGNRT